MPIILICILSLLAGCGVFIVGMNMMSGGLEKMTGAGLKRLLQKISNNRFAGLGIGAAITALIQSSSATSVMVVGFVNAGVLSLFQATSIIMGANIGTTITGLLVSLSGLNITLFTSILAFIGVMLTFDKHQKVKNTGSILCGLGLIFIGLDLMGAAFNDAEIKNMIEGVFLQVNFPLLLILIGVVMTAMIQSSSAMTGLIIVMVGQGVLPLSNALFIVLGTNIGTCITTLIACIGSNANAKRTGLIHLLFNIIGTCLFATIIWIFTDDIVNMLQQMIPNHPQLQIAVFHLIFNVVTAMILLPFIKQLVSLSSKIIKDKTTKQPMELQFIDNRLLKAPSIAVMQVKKEILRMANLAKDNISECFNILITSDTKDTHELYQREEIINYLNNAITTYLIELSSLVDENEEQSIGAYFHVVNDIERIGDHAKNFLDTNTRMNKLELKLFPEDIDKLQEMYDSVIRMFELALLVFSQEESVDLAELSSLEEKVDQMKKDFFDNHFVQLSLKDRPLEMSSYLTSTITDLERVADHLVNIGYSVINPTGTQANE